MNTKIKIIVAILLAIFFFSSCGGGDSDKKISIAYIYFTCQKESRCFYGCLATGNNE